MLGMLVSGIIINDPARRRLALLSARKSLVLMVMTWLAPAVHGIDTEPGRRLHEANCLQCHQSNIYTRPKRIVENLAGLKERVKQCELANNLLWFEEEVNAVTSYLNEGFYLFGIK